jgi:hypothetical protein
VLDARLVDLFVVFALVVPARALEVLERLFELKIGAYVPTEASMEEYIKLMAEGN